jgi:hypothetical protein
MAVPAPSIALAEIPGGVQHYSFVGEVGVSGVAQDLNIDLTAIPARIRQDPYFVEQFQLTVEAITAGITSIGPPTLTSGDFTSSPNEPNEYVTIQVSSDLATRQISLLAEARHTYTR